LAEWQPRKQNDILHYIGSKRSVAGEVWRNFGTIQFYIEPFCGSAVVYLTRPEKTNQYLRKAILNDLDLQVVNYLRAIHYHREEMIERLPTFIDGLALKFCVQNDRQPEIEEVDVDQATEFFYRLNCGLAGGPAVDRNASNPIDKIKQSNITETIMSGMRTCDVDEALEFAAGFELTEEELKTDHDKIKLNILNVDWKFSVAKTRTHLYERAKHNVGVFLDPPYDGSEDNYSKSSKGVAKDVYEWAVENASEQLRIAYCCYGHHFPCPEGWKAVTWNGSTFARDEGIATRPEQIYFSPHSELPETE
jgi:site-specific DNA-adenine methylase